MGKWCPKRRVFSKYKASTSGSGLSRTSQRSRRIQHGMLRNNTRFASWIQRASWMNGTNRTERWNVNRCWLIRRRCQTPAPRAVCSGRHWQHHSDSSGQQPISHVHELALAAVSAINRSLEADVAQAAENLTRAGSVRVIHSRQYGLANNIY